MGKAKNSYLVQMVKEVQDDISRLPLQLQMKKLGIQNKHNLKFPKLYYLGSHNFNY